MFEAAFQKYLPLLFFLETAGFPLFYPLLFSIMLIIFQVNKRAIRYGELRRRIVGISKKMLTRQLKLLCEKGVVSKRSFPEILSRVEYTLSDKRKALLPAINTIIQFGINHKL